MAFAVILIVGGIIGFIFAVMKLSEGIGFYREARRPLNDAEIAAVRAVDYSELRSEKSLKMLQDAIRIDLLPKLYSPASAVLCSPSQMILEEKEGKFIVRGHVDSQNGFGAMKRAQFRAKCVYDVEFGFWTVENVFVYE